MRTHHESRCFPEGIWLKPVGKVLEAIVWRCQVARFPKDHVTHIPDVHRRSADRDDARVHAGICRSIRSPRAVSGFQPCAARRDSTESASAVVAEFAILAATAQDWVGWVKWVGWANSRADCSPIRGKARGCASVRRQARYRAVECAPLVRAALGCAAVGCAALGGAPLNPAAIVCVSVICSARLCAPRLRAA